MEVFETKIVPKIRPRRLHIQRFFSVKLDAIQLGFDNLAELLGDELVE